MKSYRFWLNFFWIIFIFLICAIPSSDLPDTSLSKIPHLDKLAHFFLFFLMGLFLFSWLQNITSFSYYTVAFFCMIGIVFYGGIIEYLQGHFFKGRNGDILDFLFDVLGGLVAVGLYSQIKKYINYFFFR